MGFICQRMVYVGSESADGVRTLRPVADRSAGYGQRYFLEAAHVGALARRARVRWQPKQHLTLLSPLVRRRHVGGGGDDASRGDGRQAPLQDRFNDRPGPRLGRWRKRGTRAQAFGRSRDRFTSKALCTADAAYRPLAFHLTCGESSGRQSYDTLIDLPDAKPAVLVAHNGYNSDAIHDDFHARGIKPVILPRSNRREAFAWNKRLYYERSAIKSESVISRLVAPSPRITTSPPKTSSACSISWPSNSSTNLATGPISRFAVANLVLSREA